MSTQGQGQSITFAPACIGTPIVDEEFKLRYLRKSLEDEAFQFQRKNIDFLIHYYENGGKIPPPGQTMWLLDGKVVDKMPQKVSKGSAMWPEEAMRHQPEAMKMAQSTLITHPQAGMQYRLSGNAMRDHLFFATAPGNANLFVAEKKNGITTQLPVV